MKDYPRIVTAGAVLAALLVAAPAAAQRRPVLEQIAVPHNYYFREMYLPQLTTGPGMLTWSPDGRSVIYSMAGSLWRQAIDARVAVQLTDGPGRDYQPDWSPDGRRVVYASYRHDAIELRLLDIAAGTDTVLLRNGAVNVEPRWAPDGRRIAFVSTAAHGRWHVHLLEIGPAGATAQPVRITADRDSRLPRYYYSVWDQYLSPTWSPDGRELIVISNAGRIWGSGGFWRIAAAPGAEPREIHYEETSWKARPDWSPDGRRVVYSSYLGRQWNQLWLMTSEGGDPFQLTYGDFDNTNPRWSPDGTRIGYVSNRAGNTSLHLIAVPGGEITEIRADSLRYRGPRTDVALTVSGPGGRPTPARISVTDSLGRAHFPRDAWAHADDYFDRSERPLELGYFHSAGASRLALPPGRYVVEVTKGYEYARVVDTVRIDGNRRRIAIALRRMVDLPSRGWFSGDLHVHMNYGGHYRNTPARLRFQAEAEDLHVVENLIVNKEARIPDIGYFGPDLDPASTASTLIKHDEEYHTSYWGHVGLLGLTRFFVMPNYAGYVNTAAASLYPHNGRIIELARSQKGLGGYVHPFDGVPDFARGETTTNGFPMEAALGRIDYLEVVGFSDHFATAALWYRILNTGIRIPAGAGTDAMANYASLRGPVGLGRVYARSGKLDYRAWLEALRAGRTFVTNGPILGFTLDGRDPGDTIELPAAGGTLRATISLRSIVAVDSLQLVGNGQVVRSVELGAGRTRADTTIAVRVDRSGWYTLRAFSRRSTDPVLDLYPFATTSPIYVSVGGAPIESAVDARYFVQWLDQLEPQVARHPDWNTEAERSRVLADLARARDFFRRQIR